MGNMHLVTGYAGKEHITAADQGAFNAALIGTGQFVLGGGNALTAQVINSNTIRILDGGLMMQGRFIRVEPDTYVDLTIDSGTQGTMRNDLIAARYTKDDVTGVEDCSLVVIKGTAVASNPADPAYTAGDITNGQAILNDFPLWRIPINGINVGTPVSLFGSPFNESMLTLPEIRSLVNQIHSDVDAQVAAMEAYVQGKIDAATAFVVGSIYMSTVNKSPASFIGGTWEQLKDRFLIGAGGTYSAGSTGGEATHTLTVDEMPSHTHAISLTNNSDYSSNGTRYHVNGNNTGGHNTTATGGGAAHNNMPPYLAVYMWKRIA